MSTVIVFGPTGHVGSHVALSAHYFGAAKVILAMRDPSKPIPGLTSANESSHSFQRVKADLSDPSSLSSVVSSTGATRAFIYYNHASTDHMRSALEALKAGGITFVTFLSTGGILPEMDLSSSLDPKESLIYWLHAQAELNIISVFGKENYVPVRPAFFASNAFWWKAMVPTGKIKVFAPGVTVDWIAPSDIGRVSASILVGGPKEGYEEAVYLVGPQKVSFAEGVRKIVKAVTGKEAEIEEVDGEEQVGVYTAGGIPGPVAAHLVESFGKLEGLQATRGDWLPVGEEFEAQVRNVKVYTGREAQTLEEWIEEHKEEFAG
ncbi:hypothetical protein B0T25DRAFT_561150 [Lasiosphaeria hispida]|uniref:NmrA-like domain-containing protein n=1 Tax=Lasiosphaeria hispida TaxID=260671 RepID=A0AAJ0H4W1_9PEZI|nr:hypothetical protein B0T25DRAFT_561150 [Lasiosphaeria hispida]